MKIGNPYSQSLSSNAQQVRDLQRQDAQDAVRAQEKLRRQRQPETIDAEAQVTEASSRATPQVSSAERTREVIATGRSSSTQRGPQYYPFPDRSDLPASRQRALNTYSANQHLGNTVTGKSEFLGSVDVFA